MRVGNPNEIQYFITLISKSDKTMEENVDNIFGQITRILDSIYGIAVSQKWTSRKNWTKIIKEKISILGQGNGYHSCCSTISTANFGEWLFDLCWLKYDPEDFLIDSKLILECEWNVGERHIYGDFQKILVGKADLKVMIFQAASETRRQELITIMQTFIQKYGRVEKDEKYLFSCWVFETKLFQHEVLKKGINF